MRCMDILQDCIARTPKTAKRKTVAEMCLIRLCTPRLDSDTSALSLRLEKLEKMEESGEFELLPKKEVMLLKKEMTKLQTNLGGIKKMKGLPGVMFVVDPHGEEIAVKEAKKMGIPVVAITDTNCDPDDADYVIPGNDDAIRAIKLISSVMADAVIEGRQGEETAKAEAEAEAPAEKPADEE